MRGADGGAGTKIDMKQQYQLAPGKIMTNTIKPAILAQRTAARRSRKDSPPFSPSQRFTNTVSTNSTTTAATRHSRTKTRNRLLYRYAATRHSLPQPQPQERAAPYIFPRPRRTRTLKTKDPELDQMPNTMALGKRHERHIQTRRLQMTTCTSPMSSATR